jgi:dienelactone hydrolase
MTELQCYLAEEVAEDHADGIITRREAMRRLGLLGPGATAATTLLAACGSSAGAESTNAIATTAAAAAGAGESRVAAAAPFYGPFPDGGNLGRAKAAVLAIYGALDARVGATRPAAQAAMRRANLENNVMVFGGADHAFFNDTGPRFNAPAAAEA